MIIDAAETSVRKLESSDIGSDKHAKIKVSSGMIPNAIVSVLYILRDLSSYLIRVIMVNSYVIFLKTLYIVCVMHVKNLPQKDS